MVSCNVLLLNVVRLFVIRLCRVFVFGGVLNRCVKCVRFSFFVGCSVMVRNLWVVLVWESCVLILFVFV